VRERYIYREREKLRESEFVVDRLKGSHATNHYHTCLTFFFSIHSDTLLLYIARFRRDEQTHPSKLDAGLSAATTVIALLCKTTTVRSRVHCCCQYRGASTGMTLLDLNCALHFLVVADAAADDGDAGSEDSYNCTTILHFHRCCEVNYKNSVFQKYFLAKYKKQKTLNQSLQEKTERQYS
jgi:hypothetical protein